jgi:hypothetical protein
VFESWIAAGSQRLEREGVTHARARQLVTAMLAALEGAFVLARASRTTEPLLVAGDAIAAVVQAELA